MGCGQSGSFFMIEQISITSGSWDTKKISWCVFFMSKGFKKWQQTCHLKKQKERESGRALEKTGDETSGTIFPLNPCLLCYDLTFIPD